MLSGLVEAARRTANEASSAMTKLMTEEDELHVGVARGEEQQDVVDAAGHQRLQMMKQTFDATMNTKQVEAGHDQKSPDVNAENIIIQERIQLQCA